MTRLASLVSGSTTRTLGVLDNKCAALGLMIRSMAFKKLLTASAEIVEEKTDGIPFLMKIRRRTGKFGQNFKKPWGTFGAANLKMKMKHLAEMQDRLLMTRTK